MRWISTNDQTPEEYLWVLVLAMMKGTNEPCPISFAQLRDDEWYFLDEGFDNAVTHQGLRADIMSSEITHWLPIPELPEKK